MFNKNVQYKSIYTNKMVPLYMEFCRQENWSRKPSLQGIFLTQGLNVGLLQCRKILYCVSPREASTYTNIRWEFRLKGVQIKWHKNSLTGGFRICQFKKCVFFKFYFIFKLYKIVLVMPTIIMNLPQVYMCSPS